MTWKEFKDAVEAQSVSDDDVVQFLDLYPSEGVEVSWDGEGERRMFYVL